MERRLTVEQCHELLQLAGAIIEYGRMIRAYRRSAVPYIIVETPELATRFRETPLAITGSLILLRGMGHAEPAGPAGCWKLRLSCIFNGSQDHDSTLHFHGLVDDNPDRGAA
jgi:hypothetical protein